MASKTGVRNDESAIVVVSQARNGYYVRFATAKKLEFQDLLQHVAQVVKQWNPDAILIEDASAGTQIIQKMQSMGKKVVPMKAKVAKVVRVELQTALFEAGRVFFPEREHWVDDLLDELARFPTVKHDDRTDALMYALEYLQRPQYSATIGFVSNVGGRHNTTPLITAESASMPAVSPVGWPGPNIDRMPQGWVAKGQRIGAIIHISGSNFVKGTSMN